MNTGIVYYDVHRGLDMREYTAVIGQRVMRVNGANVWDAAERAALHFGSRWLEGLEFFRGNAEMAMWRTGMNKPVFTGDVRRWLDTFKAQGRSVVRWEKAHKRAA